MLSELLGNNASLWHLVIMRNLKLVNLSLEEAFLIRTASHIASFRCDRQWEIRDVSLYSVRVVEGRKE